MMKLCSHSAKHCGSMAPPRKTEIGTVNVSNFLDRSDIGTSMYFFVIAALRRSMPDELVNVFV